jgi:hypothetical protein
MVQKTVSIPIIIVCIAILSHLMFNIQAPSPETIFNIVKFLITFIPLNMAWIAGNFALFIEIKRKD